MTDRSIYEVIGRGHWINKHPDDGGGRQFIPTGGQLRDGDLVEWLRKKGWDCSISSAARTNYVAVYVGRPPDELYGTMGLTLREGLERLVRRVEVLGND